MQQRTIGKSFRQSAKENSSQLPFGGTQSGGIPFGFIAVIDGDEGRLTPHRERMRTDGQVAIDVFAQLIDIDPLFVGVGLGHARVFVNPCDRHFKAEFHFTRIDTTGDGRGRLRVRSRGQRNMAFAGEQSRGWVEAHPTGAGQENFGPGMQVRKVRLGTRWAVE